MHKLTKEEMKGSEGDEASSTTNNECEDGLESSGNIFSIDHSKTGTAKCMECKKVISQGTLRIGKLFPYKSIHIKRYLHVCCAFQKFRRARPAENVISDINQLDGINTLDEEFCLQMLIS